MEIKDVENLAEMSKIELTDAEKEQILKDMDGILGYVKQVEEVQVPDMIIEYKLRNIWREDKIPDSLMHFSLPAGCSSLDGFSITTGMPCSPNYIILSQFPDKDGGCVKVKKVL